MALRRRGARGPSGGGSSPGPAAPVGQPPRRGRGRGRTGRERGLRRSWTKPLVAPRLPLPRPLPGRDRREGRTGRFRGTERQEAQAPGRRFTARPCPYDGYGRPLGTGRIEGPPNKGATVAGEPEAQPSRHSRDPGDRPRTALRQWRWARRLDRSPGSTHRWRVPRRESRPAERPAPAQGFCPGPQPWRRLGRPCDGGGRGEQPPRTDGSGRRGSRTPSRP